MEYHYTYISYDLHGKKYHGVRTSKDVDPWNDLYLGSFTDKTFKPVGKFVQKVFSKRRTAERFESWFHETYGIASNPLWVNQINSPCGWNELCVLNSVDKRKGRKTCINTTTGSIKFFEKCSGEWIPYRRTHDKDKKWWKNKLTGKLCKSYNCPGEEWEKSGNNTSGTKWWRNEKTGERKRCVECPGEEWTNRNARNKTKASLGKIWVLELTTKKLLLIDKEQFDPNMYKKHGPNLGKKWKLDRLTGKRVYM